MPEQVTSLAGARIEVLDVQVCLSVIGWLRGESAAPKGVPRELRWALAHSDDGVTWGRFEHQAGTWRLSDTIKPELCPPIRDGWIQQLRLFGPGGEVLIWREEGGLRGRTLLDEPAQLSADDFLRPSEEDRILLGDYVMAQHPSGFTHVGDRAGLQQVLPVAVSTDDLKKRRVRLKVRHYWAQDPETGAVRVAATRLVEVYIERKS